MRVAACETTGDPNNWEHVDPSAVSPTNDHGLFQLNEHYQRGRFERVTGLAFYPNVYDAHLNATVALDLYQAHGWSRWACGWAA